jgi:hypothetical protein
MACKKGRDQQLIEKRNKKLCERYHYWCEVKRRRFDDVLRILSEEEFFISEQRIMYIIRLNQFQIDKLNNDHKQKNKQLALWS